VAPPSCGVVAVDGVGGQVEDRRVASGGQQDRITRVGLQLSGHQVPDHDASGPSVHHDQIQHLASSQHGDRPCGHLTHQRAVGPQQQLLAGLPPSVEGPGDLSTSEGTVGQGPAVLAGEGHPLGHALIDDGPGELGQSVDVGLTSPEVASLDGVIEESEIGVAIILVVLGGVDATLGGHRVGPTGTVLDAEVQHAVAQLAQGGGRGPPGQAGSHHKDGVLALVGRGDQGHMAAMVAPLAFQGTGGDAGVQDSGRLLRRSVQVGLVHRAPPRADETDWNGPAGSTMEKT